MNTLTVRLRASNTFHVVASIGPRFTRTRCGRDILGDQSRVSHGESGCKDCDREVAKLAAKERGEAAEATAKQAAWDAHYQRMLKAPRPVMPRPSVRRRATLRTRIQPVLPPIAGTAYDLIRRNGPEATLAIMVRGELKTVRPGALAVAS